MTEREEGGEEEEENSLVARHVGKLCNKELLAKQRTNVFSPQCPWWYLLCHTMTLRDSGERERERLVRMAWSSISWIFIY